MEIDQEVEGALMAKRTIAYQLKITLDAIRPPIWRRILANPNISLEQLHLIIQLLMGWHDCHMYQFRVNEQMYAPPSADADLFGVKPKSVKAKLSYVFGTGINRIGYAYDFGDGWKIRVQLENSLPNRNRPKIAECIGGKRSGPLEDSGGPYGYMQKVSLLKNPDHKNHAEIVDWMGVDFDPDRFDLKETNELLNESLGATQNDRIEE